MRELTLRPPGDKSISHRALFVAALARGTSEITNLLASHDVRSTARILRQLGVAVSPIRGKGVTRVLGRGARLRRPRGTLHCGNSGTTARLALGVLAAQPFAVRLTGDASLRARPMRRVTEPLTCMGARFLSGGDRLPLVMRGGPLMPIDWRSPVASGQIKSAVLLAGLAGGVPVRLTEPYRSRDHTERLLRALGMDVASEDEDVVLVPNEVSPFRLTVPGDASSASFLIAAALLGRRTRLTLEGVGVNPTRAGFLDVLARMGARVSIERRRVACGEPVADLVVEPAPLSPTTVSAAEVPTLVDEIPILAVLAARAEGRSVFHEVGELRVKESDRLSLIAENLRTVGVAASVRGESLVVEGTQQAPRGRVETAGDHRLAMAFAVLGTVPRAAVRLSERASPAVSFPGFFHALARVTGHARDRG